MLGLKNGNMRHVLINKLNAVLANIASGKFASALDLPGQRKPFFQAVRFLSTVALGTLLRTASFIASSETRPVRLVMAPSITMLVNMRFFTFLSATRVRGSLRTLIPFFSGVSDQVLVHDQGLSLRQVAQVPVQGLLGESDEEIRTGHHGKGDLLVRDDHLGFAGSASRLRPVGLHLGAEFIPYMAAVPSTIPLKTTPCPRILRYAPHASA